MCQAIEELIIESKTEGIEKGIEKEKINTVLKLYKKLNNTQTVADYLDLSEDEVKNIISSNY